jgi:transcriptional regulator with XRE-family HTH domain
MVQAAAVAHQGRKSSRMARHFGPNFDKAWIRTPESGDILSVRRTGRNLPTEILFAVSGPFLGGREPRILIAIHSLSIGGGPMASARGMAKSASALREIPTRLGLSQAECATALGVAVETFRTWEAKPTDHARGCRRPSAHAEGKAAPARTSAASSPADELHLHVRTLRAAAHDGRLAATVGPRPFFGKLIATATREAGGTFARKSAETGIPDI